EDRSLPPDERVRFRPGERPAGAPVPLAAPAWTSERLAKVERSYAMNYIRTILAVLSEVLGPGDAAAVGRLVARQSGMQYHATVMGMLGAGDEPFVDRLARLLSAHGRPATVDGSVVTLRQWRMFDVEAVSPAVFEAWNGLWEGLAAMEGVDLTVT